MKKYVVYGYEPPVQHRLAVLSGAQHLIGEFDDRGRADAAAWNALQVRPDLDAAQVLHLRGQGQVYHVSREAIADGAQRPGGPQ